MSERDQDFIPGPRLTIVDGSPRTGSFQFPALAAAGGRVMDLTGFAWEFVRITWVPDTAAHLLEYGFFPTAALAAAGFDPTTDSGAMPVLVQTAPDFLAAGLIDVGVPATHPFLRVEPSAGSGRCQVRNCDNVKRS